MVWDWLYATLTPEAIQEGIEAHHLANARELEALEHRTAALAKRRAELDRQAERMLAAYKAEIISLEELAKDKGLVDAERRIIEQEYARLDDLRSGAVWHDADALKAEAEELRSYMPFMTNEEKSALLDRVHLSALREVKDGVQVLSVKCRLGEKTLPIPVRRSAQEDSEIASRAGTNPLSLGKVAVCSLHVFPHQCVSDSGMHTPRPTRLRQPVLAHVERVAYADQAARYALRPRHLPLAEPTAAGVRGHAC